MTRADKYLKEGIDYLNLAREIDQYCYDNETPDEDTGLSTEELVSMFFEEEIKPTLTEDERVILRNINYMRIGRDKLGRIYVQDKFINSVREANLNVFNHLFQFIKERRRIFYWRAFEEWCKGE